MAWSADQKRIDNKKKNIDSKTRFSVWTPMSHAPTNEKVFDERREVVQKWFDKWTESQRKKILTDVLEKCNVSQLQLVNQLVKMKLPMDSQDFTRVLPRALSLYIFSFLDPRSLCRCSQVCWFWKYLTELDQIWMPKAFKLGWYLSFTPSLFEVGVWKRHYLENVRSLHYLSPKTVKAQPQTNGGVSPGLLDSKTPDKCTKKIFKLRSKPPKPLEHKPWRSNAPVANDIYRNNYLDNDDEILKARQKKMEKCDGRGDAPHMGMTGVKKGMPTSMSYKLKKAKSVSSLDVKAIEKQRPKDGRPHWAQTTQTAVEISSAETIGGVDATVRPPPLIKTTGSSAAVKRTTRNLPKTDLFPSRAWKPVDSNSSDDES